ncbi:hypothetical protein WB66_12390 [bacteria symbiont BFo1 of Frankliniella occidentalis]|nr:hypothetical protein AI28_20435 [bacteria symbiont BFo1 of Frankliniella occidentalis]KYP84497.1 hypothetical protein WB66_12390 [bacteria symbiont BFo1 of Frankliniella occidentalis]
MRVDNEVLNVLSACVCEGNNLTLTGQLDRKLYARTNKVIEAAGIDVNVGPSHAEEMEGVAKTIYLVADAMIAARGE